jgi:hypothetical protein
MHEWHSRYQIANDDSPGGIVFPMTYAKRRAVGIRDFIQYLCHFVPPPGRQVARIVARQNNFRLE